MSFSHRNYRVCGTLVLCLLLSGAVSASDSAPSPNAEKAVSAFQLLKRMSHAFRTVSYHGRFVYMANNKLRSLKVIHTNLDGQEFERLSPLSGGGPEIFRKGDELVCIHPEGNFMRLGNSIPSGPFANKFSQAGEQIDQYYRLVDKGSDRIAGRLATRYLMQPQDQYRYAYALWLDSESGLLLKATLLGVEGQDLETFEFIELNVGVDLPKKLFDYQSIDRSDDSLVVNLKGKISPSKDAAWEAGWVPGGFKMAACDVRRISARSAEVSALVYSDGISSFTVFIEPFLSSKGDEIMPPGHHGATTMHSHTVNDGGNKVMITVVGELPMNAIKKVGASVVRKK